MSSATLRVRAVQDGDWYEADRAPEVCAPVRHVMKERLRQGLLRAADRAATGERRGVVVDFATLSTPDADHEAFAAEFAANWEE